MYPGTTHHDAAIHDGHDVALGAHACVTVTGWAEYSPL